MIIRTLALAAFVAIAPACHAGEVWPTSEETKLLIERALAREAASTNKFPGMLPSLEFDKPYEGILLVSKVNKQQMEVLCPKTLFPITLGCSYRNMPTMGACHIILADDDIIKAAGEHPQIIYRHERGHCNGFPNDHKGARAATAADWKD